MTTDADVDEDKRLLYHLFFAHLNLDQAGFAAATRTAASQVSACLHGRRTVPDSVLEAAAPPPPSPKRGGATKPFGVATHRETVATRTLDVATDAQAVATRALNVALKPLDVATRAQNVATHRMIIATILFGVAT